MQNVKQSDSIDDVEQSYAYGFAQYGSGNWNTAADIFRTLCTKRPLEYRFWFALGATLQEAGSYQDALHSWAMAALLKKEDPYPHFHAAECCFSLQWTQDGALALDETDVRIDSEHPLKGKVELLREQWSVKHAHVCHA
jgi:type III secretion system low calcium response chaperone LcrH/SycD